MSSITTLSAAFKSSARAGAFPPNALSPSYLGDPSTDNEQLLQLPRQPPGSNENIHLQHQRQPETETEWPAQHQQHRRPQQHDAQALKQHQHQETAFTPSAFGTVGSAEDASAAVAAPGSGRNLSSCYDSLLASASHRLATPNSHPNQLGDVDSTPGSFASTNTTAAAAAAADVPMLVEGTAYPGRAAAMAADPAGTYGCGGGPGYGHRHGHPPPHLYTGFTSANATAAADAAGPSTHSGGGQRPSGYGWPRHGMLRPGPGPEYGTMLRQLPGCYGALTTAAGSSGLSPYAEYGEIGVPLASSCPPAMKPPSGLDGGQQESAAAAAAAAAAATAAAAETAAVASGGTGQDLRGGPPAAGGVSSPVRQPLHPQAHSDTSVKLEAASGGGAGGTVAAAVDGRMPYSSHTAGTPWTSPAKPVYKNGATAAATAAAAGAAADLQPTLPPNLTLPPSSCSNGVGISMEPASRSGGPYMPYIPSMLPLPPPHHHHHHAAVHNPYHHRMHVHKRYAWADGYGRYDHGYMPYWPLPYHQPVSRTTAWHYPAMPTGPPAAVAGGPHMAARMTLEPGGGAGGTGGPRVGMRPAAHPGLMRLPDKQQQQPPMGAPQDGAAPCPSAAAAGGEVYNGHGGHRGMYGRPQPTLMPYASPLAPCFGGGGGGGMGGAETAVTAGPRLMMRSASTGHLGSQPLPMSMSVTLRVPSSREPQQAQHSPQHFTQHAMAFSPGSKDGASLALEPAPWEPPPQATTSPPPPLEARESYKRRRLESSWSLPGPLASASLAPSGLVQQPYPQRLPQLHQMPQFPSELSLSGEPGMPQERSPAAAATAAAGSSTLPPSPFAFAMASMHATAPSMHAVQSPFRLSSAQDALVDNGMDLIGGGGGGGGLNLLAPQDCAGGGLRLGSAAAATTGYPEAGAASGLDLGAGGDGGGAGGVGRATAAAAVDEDAAHAAAAAAAAAGADLDDSFEAFAIKLGFDDLDICMAVEAEEPQQQHQLQPQQQQQQQQQQKQQKQFQPVTAAAPSVQAVPAAAATAAGSGSDGGYSIGANGGLESVGAAVEAAACSTTSPRVQQPGASCWPPSEAAPQGPAAVQQPQQAASGDSSPAPSLVAAALLSQPQHSPATPAVKADLAAAAATSSSKTDPGLLLSPVLLLTAAGTAPPPLPLTDSAPSSTRPRGSGSRRLNGNSSRTMRAQHPLLQLSSLDQLPGPVRVTVAGGSSSSRSAGGGEPGGRRGGGGGRCGGRRGSDGCVSDDDEEDRGTGSAAAEGGAGGAGGGGGGGAGHTVYGIFHVKPYLEGRKCIDHGGEMVSRSAFERAGGSIMAKWYRSIKVLPGGISLGKWLASNGLPVLKGNPRRSKKSGALADADAA